MSVGSTLPPQAYTREILAIAFNWLQSQPESTRKLASSPDALVGLYLRAQRYGGSSMEADAPVSSQNFMTDLKILAEGLKQFDDNKSKAPHTVTNTAPRANTSTSIGAPASIPSQSMSGPVGRNAPSMNEFMQRAVQSGFMAGSNPQEAPMEPLAAYANPMNDSAAKFYSAPQEKNYSYEANELAGNPSGRTFTGLRGLNPQSQRMIQEVKSHMNLDSETEVLNMLVAIAYKNLKSLLT